jgi:prepilin signal peptidase PulO-like enzyme (type II secretory pathway)
MNKSQQELVTWIAQRQLTISQGFRGTPHSKCPDCNEFIGRADGVHVLYMGYVLITCKGAKVQ